LEDLTVRSEIIAQEILSGLRSLSHKEDGTKYKSWVHAFRTIWSASKTQEMQNCLQNVRDELQFRILVSIKEDSMHGLDEPSCEVLRTIVDSNQRLTVDIRTQAHVILAEQKAEGVLAVDRHQEVLNAIFSQNLEAPSVDTITQTIKSRLYSHRQDDRFEDIPEAHQKTFTWALEKKSASQSGPDLLDWLQNESGTHWISGKAGSGKSTLMKYLVQDPRFKQALQQWAGDDQLVIATFYFWRAGAPDQRSQTGLFRSLLWQVLAQQPTMGSLLFPEQYVYGAVWKEFPTFHQLRRAFNRFTDHITGSAVVPTKVAFIVDGLDEFEKDVIDFTGLADIFLTSSRCSNVKALVSSRPLPAFESSFEGVPQLCLHYLTHGDVTAYVEAELGPRLRFSNSLAHGNNGNTELLLENIVHAASGVFLWVKLVVRSLVEGIENGDTTEDLRLRFITLPRDIEDLFEHMISNIPDFYRIQASQIFQLLNAGSGLTAINLWYAIDWDEASVLRSPVAVMSLIEKKKVERDIDRRLKSRCVGLLELRTRTLEQVTLKNGQILQEEVNQEIEYIHKTAADFIYRADIGKRIWSWTEGNKLNIYRLLLQSVVMDMKTIEFFPGLQDDDDEEPSDRPTLWSTVSHAMRLARDAENIGNVSISALLHELDRIAALHFVKTSDSSSSPNWPSHLLTLGDTVSQSPMPAHDDFLSLMVLFGLYHSVADVLSKHPQALLSKKGRPLLHYVCCPDGASCDETYLCMIKLLFEHGADPNQVFNDLNAWQNALAFCAEFHVIFPKEDAPFYFFEALTMFVKHGANPNACINVDGQRESALQVVKAWFGSFLQGHFDVQSCRVVDEYLESQRVSILGSIIDFAQMTCRMVPRHKEELRQLRDMGLNLIQLLESKGAKAQTWREENGKYVKIKEHKTWSLGRFAKRSQKSISKTKEQDPGNLWALI
jgi:hypothetical protein